MTLITDKIEPTHERVMSSRRRANLSSFCFLLWQMWYIKCWMVNCFFSLDLFWNNATSGDNAYGRASMIAHYPSQIGCCHCDPRPLYSVVVEGYKTSGKPALSGDTISSTQLMLISLFITLDTEPLPYVRTHGTTYPFHNPFWVSASPRMIFKCIILILQRLPSGITSN